MKLKLHHVNFATTDVPAMDAFYRDVLDMQTMPGMGRTRVKDQGYPGDVAFVTDGAMQMHIAEKDMEIGFRTGQVSTRCSAATSPSAPTTSRPSRSGSTTRASNIPTLATGR